MTERPRAPDTKVLEPDACVDRYRRPRAGRLVFTNGCFDILHRGHAAYLAAARQLGDMLVVALNTDASVRRLKGTHRPILGLTDRAYLIASMEVVDAVTYFDEDTPRELIARLLPDVLVKGADYANADVVGREEVEAAGGQVVLLPLVGTRSTSEIIQSIRDGQ